MYFSELATKVVPPERGDIPGGQRGALTAELCAAIFSYLPRKDQRQRGEQYLRALLETQGRKSIMNMAAGMDDPAALQRLHHFISNSTWDWKPMRAALSMFIERTIAPRARVVHSMPIPKLGEHSVGVAEGFDRRLGRSFRGQHAIGVWYASEETSAPASWRLFLPELWADDEARRFEVPDGISAETLDECASAVVLEGARHDLARPLPVILDVCSNEPVATVGRFSDCGVPVIARLAPGSGLLVHAPVLQGHQQRRLSIGQLLELVKGRRRRVPWVDPVGPTALRHSLVATVRVEPSRLPAPIPGGTDTGLVVLAEWSDLHGEPTGIWLTNMNGLSPAALVRLTKLADRVNQDRASIGEEVGLRDFGGRSFNGWHRHITLASAAHALEVVAPLRQRAGAA